MYFTEFWTHLHKAHIAVKQASPEIQATTINALFLFLQERSDLLFPALFYEKAITLLRWYLTDILPKQGYADHDLRIIAAEYNALLAQIQGSREDAQDFERMFEAILCRLQQGDYPTSRSVATAVLHIFCDPQDAEAVTLGFQDRDIQKSFNQLQTTWSALHASQFFTPLLDLLTERTEASGLNLRRAISDVRELFDYTLKAHFQGKAVFVDTFFQGYIMPIWVSVDISRSSQHVEFVNRHVDPAMQASADIARSLARQYLMHALGENIPEHLTVQCWFPDPAVSYQDTSLSVLIGLKIVGEMAGIEADPATAVTGEVNQFGQVGSVGYLPQKIEAARSYPGITRMFVPASHRETFPVSGHLPLTLIHVGTFAEALDLYYGPQLQEKIRHLSSGRRQFSREPRKTGLLAGLRAFVRSKIIPTSSLKSYDIELCTNNIEYAELLCAKEERDKGRQVLQTVLRKVEHHSSYDALCIKAQACEALGWSYVAQRRKSECVRDLQYAYSIWKSLNNKEQQAHQLLLMGAALGDSGHQEEIRQNSRQALGYLHAANDLLTLSMKTFYASRSHYYSRLGVLYYWIGEYEQAALYTAKGVELFDEFDTSTNPYYETNKQHLGRVRIQLRQYDKAYELIQSTSQSPLLQSPACRARNFRTFSDFFFAMGDDDKGLEFAQKTAELCNQYTLTIQKIGIQQVLTRYGFPVSFINLV